MPPVSITSSYAFLPLEEGHLADLRHELIRFGQNRGLKGLVLLATEGINATVCGDADVIAEWKERMRELHSDITFKDSTSESDVFRRWSVKIKPEIVGIKDAALRPQGKRRHLTPEEWQDMLTKENVVIVDARNEYEVEIGAFRGAVNPGIAAFHEFPQWVDRAQLPKNKTVMMYCTGGIRCEKALLAMEARGYEDVYQLEGGILSYLERFPEGDFEGECFVFDHRVAVDQHLHPSLHYGLCPHCGHAGDVLIRCHCTTEQKICSDCARTSSCHSCSKRCRNEVLATRV